MLVVGAVTVNADASRTVVPAGCMAGDLYDHHVAALQSAGILPTDFSNPYPPTAPDIPPIDPKVAVSRLVDGLRGIAAMANGYAGGIVANVVANAVVTGNATIDTGPSFNGLQRLPAAFVANADTQAPTSPKPIPLTGTIS